MQKKVLSLFWHQSIIYKKFVIGIGALLPPTILMHQFLPPLVLAEILRRLADGDYVQGDLWGSFGWLLALFIFLRFTSATFIWRAVIVLTWKLQAYVTRALNRKSFAYFMSQTAGFHADNFSGSLVAAAARFSTAYSQLLNAVVMQFIPLILSFAFVIAILLPRAPLYVAILVGFAVVYIVITILGTKKVRERGADFAKAESAQTGALADTLTNSMAIKSFAASSQEQARYDQALNQSFGAFSTMMRTTHSRELYFSTITATITSVSMVLAVASVVLFNEDIATTFLIIEYTGLLTGRLWEFTIGTLRTYNRAIGDATDMVRFFETPPQIQDGHKPEKSRISKGAISIEGISFTHLEAGDALFNTFSLSIKRGEKVGLVGHSGAGKTTLVKLLLRFADIDSGKITIDGQNITHIRQDDLRRAISYVPQEPLLFHRSIKENIAYGNPSASEADIVNAAKQAYAHDFIAALPQGYDTLVGEHGIKLSGGQRQRIAIARALLKAAPILILDEATSALDSESERAIQSALLPLMKGRTTLVIAHRLSTIQKLDRIVVLENGVIIEQGTHNELLEKSGHYAKLWQQQSNGMLGE